MTYQNVTLHIEFLSLLLQTGEIKIISVNEYLLIFSRFNGSTIYSLSRNKVKCVIGCFYSVKKKSKTYLEPGYSSIMNFLGKNLMPDSSSTIFAKIVIIDFEPSKKHLKFKKK